MASPVEVGAETSLTPLPGWEMGGQTGFAGETLWGRARGSHPWDRDTCGSPAAVTPPVVSLLLLVAGSWSLGSPGGQAEAGSSHLAELISPPLAEPTPRPCWAEQGLGHTWRSPHCLKILGSRPSMGSSPGSLMFLLLPGPPWWFLLLSGCSR